MATKTVKIRGFTLKSGSKPPRVVRSSKYDALVEFIIEHGTWQNVTPDEGGPTLVSARQQLADRGRDLIQVSVRGDELWAAPIGVEE